MRAALRAARSQPLRRVHKPGPGRPPWPAPHASLRALVNRGLLTDPDRQVSRKCYPMDVWQITPLGIESLEYVAVKPDPVRSLHIAVGSTRLMQLGTWVDVRMPEPEAMGLAA